MVGGNWTNADGLYLQFGTSKATPEIAGDYLSYGSNRLVECKIDLTKLTATIAIQSNTTFFPQNTNMFIEKVEVVNLIPSASGTTFSVGIVNTDRSTIPAGGNTAFVAAMTNAITGNAGFTTTLQSNSTFAGTYIGEYLNTLANTTATTANLGPWYITALSSGTYTAGLVLVRVFYHGEGTISQ